MPKTTQNTDLQDFFATIAPSANFGFGAKQIWTFNNGYPRLIKFFRLDETEQTADNLFFRKDKDYYITKNSFIADKRDSDCLFSIDNIAIDIDKHTGTDYAEIDYEIDRLIYILDNDYQGKFPEFNIVRTGRGVHLWIKLESFAAKSLSIKLLYNMICGYFCDSIAEIIAENDIQLTVDRTASVDATRMLRIPTTYNQARKGFKAVWEHRTDRVYSIQELMQEFPIDLHKEAPRKPQTQADNDNTADFKAMHVKRTSFIESLIADNNGDCCGKRDKLLLLWYNHAVMIMDNQTAADKLHKLNKRFTEPLKPSEIKLITNYIDTHGHLKFKTATFFDWCECTLKQRMEYTSNSQRELEREEARKRKAQRNAEIHTLKAMGLSVRKIAQTLGCSPTTVQAVLKAEPIPCRSAELNVSELGIEDSVEILNEEDIERLNLETNKEPATKVVTLTVAELAISDYRSAPTGCYCGEPQRSP